MKALLFTIVSLFLIAITHAQDSTDAKSYGPQVPDSTGSNVSREEAQQALDLHNKFRAEVGVDAMEWSQTIAAFAQDWADKLAANNCAFEHRPNSPYGENIFSGWGTRYTVMDASNNWYSEIKKFDTNNPQSGISTAGHYTQMVWRNTTQLGMGVSTCSNGHYIIVANYSPRGNMQGEKPY